jgi:hypothetical protein
MLDHDAPYYCQACDSFHDERTCARYIEMIKASSQGDDGYLDSCNNVLDGRKMFHLSQENMQQVKDKSIEAQRAIELFGEKPSQEEIKRMYAIDLRV